MDDEDLIALTLSLLEDDDMEWSSDSDSEYESDSDLINPAHFEERTRVPKVNNYVSTVVPAYSDDQFIEHFRISRESCQNIIDVIENEYLTSRYRPQVPCYNALLMTLWYMANQECFRSVADRFNFSKGEAHNLLMTVVDLIISHADRWIIWPKGEKAVETVNDFNALPGNKLKGIIGALDGCHIPIPKQKHDPSYINRYRHASINLTAICDSNLKFTYIFCGWPGCAHDSWVWKNSSLHSDLENHNQNREQLPLGAYIVGDLAYELRTFTMTMYKLTRRLTNAESNYNDHFKKLRVFIERAFGRLKGIFRRLMRLETKKPEYCCKLITLGCILHNIAIDDRVLCPVPYLDLTLGLDNGEYGQGEDDDDNVEEVHVPDQLARQRRLADKRQAKIFRQALTMSLLT